MAEMKIMNGKITGTMLGFEDRGILSCGIHIDTNTGSSTFGGYSLGRDGEYLGFIPDLLKTLKLEKWEQLKGQLVRIKVGDQSEHPWIRAIGHILEDHWFSFEEWFEKEKAKRQSEV